MATTTEVSKGVIYTEGPELPNLAQDAVGTAPVAAAAAARSVVVQTRPMRLEEDGNNYSLSTTTITYP